MKLLHLSLASLFFLGCGAFFDPGLREPLYHKDCLAHPMPDEVGTWKTTGSELLLPVSLTRGKARVAMPECGGSWAVYEVSATGARDGSGFVHSVTKLEPPF
jgi:hypothetical protein